MDNSISQNEKKGTTKDGRYRNWTIVLYPESAPENWREQLNGQLWVESPLHDKDVNADGTPKKPHWHILLKYEGRVSYNQVKQVADDLHGASPQYVHNIVGMIRYFAHMDNPEKHQYSPSSIIGHGVNVSEYLETDEDIENSIRIIEDFIDEKKITEYAVLCRLSRIMADEHPTWHKLISTHTIHFSKYLSSCRHSPRVKDFQEKDETLS